MVIIALIKASIMLFLRFVVLVDMLSVLFFGSTGENKIIMKKTRKLSITSIGFSFLIVSVRTVQTRKTDVNVMMQLL